MEDNKYKVYRGFGKLVTGEQIKLESSIYENLPMLKGDIDNLANNNLEELEAVLKTCEAKEHEVFKELEESLSKWEEVAKQTLLYRLAVRTKKDMSKQSKHTNNVWIDCGGESDTIKLQMISNNTYSMRVNVYTRTKYNRETGQQDVVSYDVSWGVSTNSPISTSVTIAHVRNKKFKASEYDKMCSYVEGRKKAYSNYFKEEYPPVPKEYKDWFCSNGVLLPNYRVED